MIKHVAFGCAVLSLLILAGATIAGGLAYPGYDHWRQYISELGATGAPTGDAVSLAFIASGVLLTAFWLICAILFRDSRLAVLGFALSALNGLGLLFGGVFQCDFECSLASPSPEAVLHDVFGGLGYLCGIVGVLVVGLAWRNRPDRRGLFRLSLLCGVPAAMAIWLIHPGFEWYGAAQRIVELALAIWTVAVALEVRTQPRGTA
ncbi:MAG: DUF998 domain-containing protein [Brevundimonas sp.]